MFEHKTRQSAPGDRHTFLCRKQTQLSIRTFKCTRLAGFSATAAKKERKAKAAAQRKPTPKGTAPAPKKRSAVYTLCSCTHARQSACPISEWSCPVCQTVSVRSNKESATRSAHNTIDEILFFFADKAALPFPK